MARRQGPTEIFQWMIEVLEALRALGGSAKPREVSGWIANKLQLPADVLDATTRTGAPRFHNQVQWARQYLVWGGLLDDGRRGVWTLSPLGWHTRLDSASARALYQQVMQALRETKAGPTSTSGDIVDATTPTGDDPTEATVPAETGERDLLAVLKALPPRGFELICGRLLREHGFEDVQITRLSRDGGIDGYGLLRLSPFVSLRVAFQAKRYQNVVSRREVGEFRNALLGRAEKGVFITTGRFTVDAETEASRDGVVPIELIDGEQLVELFRDKLIGLKPRTVYDIDLAFFEEFRRQG